jgi:hypothetical protein
VTTFCYGQETSKDKSPFCIKTNLTHYITGTAYISCEKIFDNDYLRPEIGLGIIYPFKPWLNYVLDNPLFSDENAKLFYGHGYSFKVQNKFVIEKSQNDFHGYVSPLFLFKHVSIKDIWITYLHQGQPHLTSYKKNIFELGFLCGIEKLYKNILIFDFYFGLGYRLVREYDSFGKYSTLTSSGIATNEETENRYPSFAIHLGLNIGINIVKK